MLFWNMLIVKFYREHKMKIIPIGPNIDIENIPQIDRVCDSNNIYIIETSADYAALPASVQAAIAPPPQPPV